MNPEIRLFNRDNVFGISKDGGRVEIFADGEWHDVRHRVSAVNMNLVVGEPSRVSVSFIVSEVDFEGLLDEETIAVMASFLRDRGWDVKAPELSAA